MLSFTSLLSTYRLKSLFAKRGLSRGSIVSKFFRPIFEHARIKVVIGISLASITLFSSVLSPSIEAVSATNEVISQKAIELTTQSRVRLPLLKLRINQSFSSKHLGIDLGGAYGDPIYPIMSGKVQLIAYDRFGYGNHIVISHDSGFESLYGHLSKIEVFVGEEVANDTIIGRMGSTGWSSGNHLHLEVYEDGKIINPAYILPLK